MNKKINKRKLEFMRIKKRLCKNMGIVKAKTRFLLKVFYSIKKKKRIIKVYKTVVLTKLIKKFIRESISKVCLLNIFAPNLII